MFVNKCLIFFFLYQKHYSTVSDMVISVYKSTLGGTRKGKQLKTHIDLYLAHGSLTLALAVFFFFLPSWLKAAF